jgi:glyoxalase family protein
MSARAIRGLHHITLVSADAQRTVDFYTGALGLRLDNQTVNFDDPGSCHLYFGNQAAEPGSLITYFEWRGAARGAPGIGGTHHFAMTVADQDGQLRWKRRLTDLGVAVTGPFDRRYFTSIYFTDPDGAIIEIATAGPGFAVDEPADRLGQELRPPDEAMMAGNRDEARIAALTWPEPVAEITPEMTLRRMHHITAIGADIAHTDAFLGGLLRMRRVKKTTNFDDPGSAHWYWDAGAGGPGTILTYFERDPRREQPARMGAGQTHHYALSVPDETSQLEWRERLLAAGLPVSPVMDRVYFTSIYTRDPDGHIVELATAGPGFMVDERAAALGRRLQLPPWLEQDRTAVEARLRPLQTPEVTG